MVFPVNEQEASPAVECITIVQTSNIVKFGETSNNRNQVTKFQLSNNVVHLLVFTSHISPIGFSAIKPRSLQCFVNSSSVAKKCSE